MPAIPFVGLCFSEPRQFEEYLNGQKFGAWRPRFVTVHHTGAPNGKQWQNWQMRNPPISDAQWMANLARYYGNEMGWRSGPHFFVTAKNFCVLSPPTARGVHAVSFNAVSWGVETVGDFDSEPFTGAIRTKLIECLAVLHIAAGLQLAPYARGERGLHFHRDDPKTSKTCPGRKVDKAELIAAVQEKIDEMTGGDHVDEKPADLTTVAARGRVNSSDDLNVRGAASGKGPVVRVLKPGAEVGILGSAMNGETKWLRIADDEWVAARFISQLA